MKSIVPLLQIALDAAGIIARYKPDRAEQFLDDPLLQDAVCMRLQQLGDSLSQVRRQFPEIYRVEKSQNWDQMIGLRNVLAHRYGSIDMTKVWNVIDLHLPLLVAELDETVRRAGES